MNFGLAFSFPFQDPDWLKKIAIVALISLIPVVGQLFLFGWAIEITRRVIRRETVLLPDVDFGTHLVDGLRIWVITLVYSLPIAVITIPVGILAGMAGNSSDPNALGAAAGIAGACLGLVAALYGILMGLVLPAALANFAMKGTIGAGLNFQEAVLLFRAAPGAYVIGILGAIVAGFIAQLGLILCVVGVFLTATYYAAVTAHFYGQSYNEAIRNKTMASPQVFPL